MGLRLWYPFDGTIRNLGTLRVPAFSHGTNGANWNGKPYFSHTTGKLGKSIYFPSGQPGYIKLNSTKVNTEIFNGKPFTIAGWVMRTANSAYQTIFSNFTASSAAGFIIGYNASGQLWIWANNNGTNILNGVYSSFVFSTGWTHFAIVYTGTQFLCYKDGVLNTTVTPPSLAACWHASNLYNIGNDLRISTYPFYGRMNDFRIYDYAISGKEVKEISRGLIVHMKLDGFGEEVGGAAHYGTNVSATASNYQIANFLADSSGYNHSSISNAWIQPGTAGGLMVGNSPVRNAAAFFLASGTTQNYGQYLRSGYFRGEGFKTSFTISFWAMSATNNATNYASRMIFGIQPSCLNLWTSGGNLMWNTNDSAQNPILNSSGANVSAAPYYNLAWHHFVLTSNGSVNNLYIDNVLVGHSKVYLNLLQSTGSSPVNRTDPCTIYISGFNTTNNYRWWGGVSDFRLYSTVLSTADIAELYNMKNKSISIDSSGTIYAPIFIERGAANV